MSQPFVHWGILGTGAIAKTFARGVANSKTGKVIAVASRSQEKAEAFGNEFQAPHRHGSYEALLADQNVQAVYIATPHPWHAEWAIKAAEAKRHVLVEKPIALNQYELMAMTEAALENDVMLMEAFMYRCHPQTAKLVELLKDKVIGDVRLIQSTFGFQSGFNPSSRLFANDLAGGGILDVGCYTASMARLIAGASIGKDFADPIEVKGIGTLTETGVDGWAAASLKFANGTLAQLATGVQAGLENVVRIFGTEGRIFVPNPWVANRTNPDQGKIIVHKNGEKESREINIEATVTSFAYEADVFGNAVLAGKQQALSPAMSWDDSLGNLRTLDAWRSQIGLLYNAERAENYTHTVSRRPLARRPKHNMKYGTIPHLDKPVSRLVMGCDNQIFMSHAAVMFDDWFSRGGTTFDTAFVYGGGTQEKLLGQWAKNRGIRDQLVFIAKGAHTPMCFPNFIPQQLEQSLDRLQSDHADIYIMHRDNPDVPVGEFVDVLNDLVKAGRIKAFGGSNWSIERMQAANDYAAANGKQAFSLLSNNFSLARMVDAVWKGCIAASDEASRAWLTKTQLPLFAWSSQARGFFLPGNARPDKKDDKELVRCWYSEDNFRRLDRVNELARKRNVLPINIALAYVLCQPFPTFALIGPRQLSETRTSLPALDVALSADEVRWLNLDVSSPITCVFE